MRNITGSVICFIFASAAYAQIPEARFGFQEVMLGAAAAQVPDLYKGDCGAGKDLRFQFCYVHLSVGSVPMSIRISFMDERVLSIDAWFPSEEFDTVWLSLRDKYGVESSRLPGTAKWEAYRRQTGGPVPDHITLRREPKVQPLVDGRYFMQGTRYSGIEFESFWVANEATQRMQQEQDKKTKGVAERL